ncbi:nickel-dependent lactate racemase [Candidatus Bathyarchaeota archaeon]|nr:nickel-dependent lactate racemase [Candidatus Bathyarchaeota archaeon]
MVDAWLPYGKTEVCVRVPARNFLGLIKPNEQSVVVDPVGEIERALKEPIGTLTLSEIVDGKNSVAVVVDDFTRSFQSETMLLLLLSELNASGIKDKNISVIFGCGTHRAVRDDEANKLLGEAIIARVKTISHNCRAQDLVFVGKTKRHGNRVYLNRVFAEAEVKILLGDVGFHYYAGYGGGRKSVLPAVSGVDTIKDNHALLLNTSAKTGVLTGNPVHEDMTDAARLANIDFIVNVVANAQGEVVKAFAGDLEQAFFEATKLVDAMYRVQVDRKADVVVVSPGGFPADINLYQSYPAVDNVLSIAKRGGVVILVAECSEGHGDQTFYDWMVKFGELKPVAREIKRNFVLGGHKAYYLLKALQNHKIILLSSMPEYYASNIFKLKAARAVNDALNEAFTLVGRNAKVWVLPYGNQTLPEVK